MTENSEQAARSVLAMLEESLATHNVDQVMAFWTDDAVLIADADENFDGAATAEYLGHMADMPRTVRWQWDQVAVVLDAPGLLSFTAAGNMGFHDASGQLLQDRGRFRVTCLAVEGPAGWRLKHFHGSAPRAD